MAAGNFSAEHGSDRAMNVAHGQFDDKGRAGFESSLGLGEQLMIERLLQAMFLRLHAAASHARGSWRGIENCRQIEAACFPVIDSRVFFKHVDAADHLVYATEAEFGHILPHLFGQKKEKVNDMLGLPLEKLTEHELLRGDSD